MKKTVTASLAFLALVQCLNAQAQQKPQTPAAEDFVFTTVKELPITSIKDQSRSGTCWDFSSLSFMESELLRQGKPEYDLSEMYVVYWTYFDKVIKYVRTDGWSNIAQGGAATDFLHVLRHYGMVPDEVMPGLNYGEKNHTHGELEAVVGGLAKAVKSNPNKRLSTAWKNALKGVLDAYLGEVPETFQYNGKEYTPQTFAQSLGFNPDDYVSITSFMHQPYYSQFAIEVADNWLWDLSYNVPLDDLMAIMDNAINTGYTVLWASDVSESGFTRNGVGYLPTSDESQMSGSDQARWIGMDEKAKSEAKKGRLPEIGEITEQMRQDAYDNKETTDDHGMHMYGIAKDQNGEKFYMIKNSWGDAGKYHGIWYISEKFVRYKTMDIMVHKDAIPKDIRKKMGIK